jgi:hypothetical protein
MSNVATPVQPAAESILQGYVEQGEFARAHRITTRTVARYRDQADGLPSVMFGGKIYIPLHEASAWLSSRIRHPNKRRA